MPTKNLKMKKLLFLAPKLLKTAGVFGLLTILTVTSVVAANLSDEEKAQKRQDLEKFFSNALIQTKPEAVKKTYQTLQMTGSGSTRYGYDSNVDLDSSEESDFFYQEKIGGKLEYAPERASLWGMPILGGVEGRYDYWGYFDRDDMNRQTIYGAPYLQLNINQDLELQAAYEFRARLYDTRDDLSYFSNGAKTSLTHRIIPGLTQKGTFSYERLDYTDRAALLPDGNFSASDRQDNRYEVSYGIRDRIGPWTIDLGGSWLWNDSNDQYFDYNDFNEAGIDGSVSYRATERLVLTGFGGWHKREYDSRLISPEFTTVQSDDWYYAGARAFYAINAWSGLDVTFTYYQNDSNDPNHEYDSMITSAGYHIYF